MIDTTESRDWQAMDIFHIPPSRRPEDELPGQTIRTCHFQVAWMSSQGRGEKGVGGGEGRERLSDLYHDPVTHEKWCFHRTCANDDIL